MQLGLQIQKQKGYTLIELMIGLLVGLIVLSAVIYAFISTLRSSADILNSARLNREMSNLSDIVAGELRRIGYWPVNSGTDSPFGASPDLALLPAGNNGVDATCILYSYYNDSVSPGAQIYRGMAMASGALYYSDVSSGSLSSATNCDPVGDGWAELSNPSFLTVNDFSLTLECYAVLTAASTAYNDCKTTAGASYTRAISFALDVELDSDSSWTSSISDTVKLQNDLSN